MKPDEKNCPECGIILCQLCEEKHAKLVIVNSKNGNRMKICTDCNEEMGFK